AGSVAGNNLIRSLGCDPSIDIVGCATDRFTLKRSLAQRNYLVPVAAQPLVRSLRRLIQTERIDLIIPNSDADVALVSKLRDRLPCRTFVPKQQVIERCSDKFEL